MERLKWTKTIKTNILMLKLVGLWPKGDETYKYDLYFLYKITCIVFFQVGHLSFETSNLFMNISDLEVVTGTIFLLLTQILVTIKSYLIMKNMKILKKLTVTLESDIFQPKNAHQKDLVQANFKSWRLIAYVSWATCAFWLVFWASFPVLDKSFKEYRFPSLAWYPYDVKSSPQYELTYLYQFVAQTYLLTIHANADTLVAALNMYIAAQIDILCDDLRNLRKSEQETSMEVNRNLMKCIHLHREIVKFADHANEFYNWLLLGVFFVGGIALGLALFQLTLVAPFSMEFYSLVSYASGMAESVFLYCWFGNEIEIKSTKFLYAVFESDWIDLEADVKKNLIIFCLRLQKPLQIFAVGLFSLSLDTFMRIIKTSYSYFALLRNVNSPNY